MKLGERVKMIRESIKDKKGKSASMATFAEMLGVTSGAVSQWEHDQKSPSQSIIRLIVEKFGVSESWLLTGSGEMYVPMSDEDEIIRITKEMFAEGDERRKKLFQFVASLDDDELAALQNLWKKADLFFNIEKDPG